LKKVGSTGGGPLTPRSSHPELPPGVELGAPIGLIRRSEPGREQSPLATLEVFFDGLLVDIAHWFELLREHQQGRIQVDEAPGLMRAGLRRGHSDRWLALNVTRSAFWKVLITATLACYRREPDATCPEIRRPSV
jgi:hypothetical protein